ncbi:glycosyltransferase [Marinilactibacillus sp. Marseille-P9653]|uniref:glycosyltransferase n=1 Tax=Marinilactibacillus sp. Marseille-P9653 TaxID=2866583 RepID=UPI001CE3BBBC|nr:glycosyltransferase [Marinilactibacillus sp. Marseille-P9653]
MIILHYTLGFPPHRSGGLVKYATDLMKEQFEQGHEVIALYPGKIKLFSKKTYIKSGKSDNFKLYQIVNSLPLAIFGGISSPIDFMREVPIGIYINLLKKTNPDVIHVHTLMGIHKEFFTAAKNLNIPIVFTTHDYYGLAPEPNFYFDNKSYDQKNVVENWILASEGALSTNQLRIFQFSIYPIIKSIVTFIKTKNSTSKFFSLKNKGVKIKSSNSSVEDFLALISYYKNVLSMIDGYHFNSSLSREVYSNNIDIGTFNKVISITNSNISNFTYENKTKNNKTRLAYIGPDKDYKGFFDFIELSKRTDLKDYEFHTYGYESVSEITNVIQHGRYKNSELNSIYRNIDILIVPSRWKETFGLIVLEALSTCTPVLVSNNVGAKDLVPNHFVFSSLNEIVKLLKLNTIKKEKFDFQVKNMNTHTKEILLFYIEVGDSCNEN